LARKSRPRSTSGLTSAADGAAAGAVDAGRAHADHRYRSKPSASANVRSQWDRRSIGPARRSRPDSLSLFSLLSRAASSPRRDRGRKKKQRETRIAPIIQVEEERGEREERRGLARGRRDGRTLGNKKKKEKKRRKRGEEGERNGEAPGNGVSLFHF